MAMGDAHVYVNHVEPLKEQLKNAPRAFPVDNPLPGCTPCGYCISIPMGLAKTHVKDCHLLAGVCLRHQTLSPSLRLSPCQCVSLSSPPPPSLSLSLSLYLYLSLSLSLSLSLTHTQTHTQITFRHLHNRVLLHCNNLFRRGKRNKGTVIFCFGS